MSNEHKHEQQHSPRRMLRLSDYDYGTSGAYYVTICAKGSQAYFQQPVLAHILEEDWANLPLHFKGITPDTFVVMPNHIHGIIWINAEIEQSPMLSAVIGGYKSIVNVAWIHHLKGQGMNGPQHLWKRSFHDHIIRNEQDLREKRNYILKNPIVAHTKAEQRAYEKNLKREK